MSNIQTTRQKVAEANVDVICVGGFTVKKGQRVHVEMKYSKDWPHGGFRTYINGIWFTNADAYYDCFQAGS